MATTPTTCSQCVAYNEQLNSKAEEVKTLQEHILKLAHELQDESKKKEEVQERLNDKLIRLNDYAIKIRSLEEQLQSATDRRPIGEISRAEVNSIIGRDLERIHSQLIEKDIKIMELNDTVLEKERHIIELQEMCREQEEIMQAKAKAFHIIQQKLLDLGTRTTREDSTETEAAYVFESLSPLSSLQQSQKERRRQHDFFSPGHAVVHLKMGSSGSPPPIDPSEECSSLTQDNGNIQDDFDADDGGSASFLYKKKHRKRVTFDLPPRKEFRNGNGQEEGDDITQTIIDVTAENDQLRQTIQEMEKCASDSQNHLSQLQTQLDEMRRNGRNQVLKTRASMQGKIRDLEDKISTMSVEHTDRVEHLNASIETLRADREWTLEENARLLKLLSSYREKLNDAWEALDARQEESKELRSKLDNDRALIVQLADDLEEAQQTANILLEQKISVLDDVERLKEALEAQDQYIELLEKDTMIYEEHVGLLRDSLGASKAERKALIRSKAYEAKLKALEQEKEQMNRRSNDEKLHIKALSLKISSLEAEKAVLITRSSELESRLIQLGKSVSNASVIAPSFATVTPSVVEDVSTSVSSGSAFRPVHIQMMMHMGRTNERQEATGSSQWPMPENIATEYGHHYDEKLINNMRTELNAVREECSLAQEKIVQMGCVNFELEHELKVAKEKFEKAEIRAREAEEETEKARRNCAQHKKRQKSLQSEFSAKFSAVEKEVNDLKKELALKNEQLKARMVENNKRNEELKQWRFAVNEMEAVHTEIQMLEKELNNEKAAMESKWAEVRSILLERKDDMSRKTSSAESSVTGGEQSTVTQLRQMMDTISDLKNTVEKQAKQLEHDKAEKRQFKAVIRQLQADREALAASSGIENSDREQRVIPEEAQIIGLQRQRDFMDREMTLLCTLNNSKDILIQALQSKFESICSEKPESSDSKSENDRNEDKNNRTEQLQAQIEVMSHEKSEVLNLLAKSNIELEGLQMHAQRLQMECDWLQSQLQFSPERNLNAIPPNASTHQHAQLQQPQQQMEYVNGEIGALSMAAKLVDGAANKSVDIEMKAQMERSTEALQQTKIELQKVLNENETLKIKCAESIAALDLLSNELERRSQEKDAIIEMLQSQHTYLTQTILLNERSEEQLTTSPTVSQSTNTDIEPKYMQDASTAMDGAENGPISVMHFSKATEARQKLASESLCEVVHSDNSILELENQEVCPDRLSQMPDNLTDDARQLMILNAELETAVEVLKGEIWTLNEQLKGSLVDREDLSEKLCELSQRHEEEIERARERERDLEEQKDMAERSQRQAALAENESNRRLVEWQEKSAQMENSRIELENAYVKLSEYYQQLQQAYNDLYARFNICKVDCNTQTIVDNNVFNEEFAEKIKCLENELAQRKTELKGQEVELQYVRDLLHDYLHAALKNVKDLRKTSLELLKDIIVDSVQMVQTHLRETLIEVRSNVEEMVVKWFKEKEMKDAEIAVAVQQLMHGIPTGSISQTGDLSLSVIVDAVNKKFLERGTENTALKNDLVNERNDKSVSEKEEESELKIKELENLLQVTQFSLTEHIIRCQQLQAKLDVLDSTADQNSAAAAKYGTSGSDPWNCSTPCTICRELSQTKQPVPTPQLQLAILAARLTTKIADNDALFRCNAELAETNLRLQDEISELREQMDRYIASTNNTDTLAINQQLSFQEQISKQSSNQSLQQKPTHTEKKEWIWDAELVSSSKIEGACQQSSSDQQITGFMMKNEIKTPSLGELESQGKDSDNLKNELDASRKFEEKNEMEKSTERLGMHSEVSDEYCLKHEIKVEEVKDGMEIRQYEDARDQKKLKETFEDQKLKVSRTNSEESLPLRDENMQLTDSMRNSYQELEELKKELQCIETSCGNGISRELFQARSTDKLEEQKEAGEREFEDGNGWIGTIEEDRMQLLQELEGQLKKNEIKIQEFEKENISLDQQLKSQQRLIEGLEKKLNMIEEYSITLEKKNVSMEQEITNQKKKYEELTMEKDRLRQEVENKITMKFHEEIMLLKQENESLLVKLARKQASLDKEKANMKTGLANLEYQLADREIVIEKLRTKLEHTQEESIQMQRQLDGCGMRMSEIQGKNEVDQEFHEQLVEAQRKITELEHRLDQVMEQNGLLKNSEQKLMGALAISNEHLGEMETKNKRLESEISDLKTSLLKAEEMAKKTNRSEKLMHGDASRLTEVHGKAEASLSTMQLLDSPVIIDSCCPVQQKTDELKEKFNKTLSDNALVEKNTQEMKTKFSALEKKKGHLSAAMRKKSDSPLPDPLLQKTIHHFSQANDDKLRRRKGGGFQGAEKI